MKGKCKAHRRVKILRRGEAAQICRNARAAYKEVGFFPAELSVEAGAFFQRS
jgi:hypothetical protein